MKIRSSTLCRLVIPLLIYPEPAATTTIGHPGEYEPHHLAHNVFFVECSIALFHEGEKEETKFVLTLPEIQLVPPSVQTEPSDMSCEEEWFVMQLLEQAMSLFPVVGALLGTLAGTAPLPGLQTWLGDLVVAEGTFLVIKAEAKKTETIDATDALRPGLEEGVEDDLRSLVSNGSSRKVQ